ncbi:MAG: pilus assembly protein PilP [Deltaproteobacteria bacterium]|nr:pilus assembly protein PilP [Deltaproteobacteria bacterium]
MNATRSIILGLLVTFTPACEEEAPVVTDGAGDASAAAAASGSASAKAAEPPPIVFTEADFIESDESRDPYREYTSLFVKPVDEVSREIGRKVKAPMYALDEMKLVGIIGGSAQRAMLVDPKGYGWILLPGDFIGKAELVNTGGTEAQEVPLNWKVDRIREMDVVFVREDPARPQIARTTRILPLHSGDGRGGT